jgi:hypothetical protein
VVVLKQAREGAEVYDGANVAHGRLRRRAYCRNNFHSAGSDFPRCLAAPHRALLRQIVVGMDHEPKKEEKCHGA